MAKASPMARQERKVIVRAGGLRRRPSARGAGARPENQQEDQRSTGGYARQEQRRDDSFPTRESLILFVHFSLPARAAAPGRIAGG